MSYSKDSYISRYKYNDLNNLTEKKEYYFDKYNQYNYQYNQENNISTMINGDIYKYQYDKLGNITRILKNGETVNQYFYDMHNQLIKEKNSDKTIVIVSHSISSIKQLCDRAIWLYEGEKKLDGNVNEVIDEYIKVCG